MPMRPIPSCKAYNHHLSTLAAEQVLLLVKDSETGKERRVLEGFRIPILHDFEHYRIPLQVCGKKLGEKDLRMAHLAVMVGKDGRLFPGVSICSYYDNYNRKKGFHIAVGRALVNLMKGRPMEGKKGQALILAPLPEGVALRDKVRSEVDFLIPPVYDPFKMTALQDEECEEP